MSHFPVCQILAPKTRVFGVYSKGLVRSLGSTRDIISSAVRAILTVGLSHSHYFSPFCRCASRQTLLEVPPCMISEADSTIRKCVTSTWNNTGKMTTIKKNSQEKRIWFALTRPFFLQAYSQT
ncbi:hypothetical protein CLIB1423_20S00210 [[Candida] railenensis]|uniref:Uncharacterized protein n=1 Tax=[Candida] railenensis TaxID=45579 RepID=A0A9P0W0E0_9ASCO|nr:hypothetical protein CLIB1423_20S00210 [[Candida] railenensis]